MPPILFGLAPPFRSSNAGSGQRLGVPPFVAPLDLPQGQYLIVYGTTKTSAGVILGGCTVHLFRTADDVEVDQTLSDVNGYYEFRTAALATTYYLVAYKAGTPDVAGTTVNTVVGSSALSGQVTSSYAQVILATAGLVGYWRMGEASGSVLDSTANANSGTTSGTVTRGIAGALNTGNDDGAIEFKGTTGNTFVSIPRISAYNFGDTFSIEFWWRRFFDTGITEWLMNSGNTAGPAVYMTSSEVVRLVNSPAGADILSATGTFPVDGLWHMLVFTKAGATGAVYVDGNDRTNNFVNSTVANGSGSVIIGDNQTPASTADFGLDEFALYNVALSPADVLAHYNAR
jgi:hypothetical protein